MKLSSDFILLLIVITFSVVDVTSNKTCKVLYDECNKNEDCCSNFCYLFLSFLKGTCEYNKTELSESNINVVIGPEYTQEYLQANCTYYKQENDSINDDMFKRFNINAAHNKLLPYTKTKVSLSDTKFVTVTINDLALENSDDMALYLSEKAAKKLGIIEEGTVPCNIEILDDDLLEGYIRCFLIFAPFFLLSFAVWMNNV